MNLTPRLCMITNKEGIPIGASVPVSFNGTEATYPSALIGLPAAVGSEVIVEDMVDHRRYTAIADGPIQDEGEDVALFRLTKVTPESG